MAAPLESKYSLTKKKLKIVLSINFTSIFLVLCFVYFPLNGRSSFDFIQNCLKATKCATVILWTVNICNWLILNRTTNYRSVIRSKNFPCLVKGFMVYICCILFAHVIIVLFGAPLTETVDETFHFALILATASLAPCLVHFGINTDTWIRIFACNSPETVIERVVQFTAVSSIVGAWLGAFPIPLDWDRPWQIWPITCVLGTLHGYVGGLVSSSVYLIYQCYKLNKVKFT